MPVIVVAPHNVANFPEGGGHFWVYMQYVQGLRDLGCDVYWLERFARNSDQGRQEFVLDKFHARMERFGLGGRSILYSIEGDASGTDRRLEFLNTSRRHAEGIMADADLLLNFHYAMEPIVLERFARTALVDIDPGLLQFWISTGQISVAEHDFYLTTGESIGTASSEFSDRGMDWFEIRPPVSLEHWPYVFDAGCTTFSTISSWWGGGGRGEFITDRQNIVYENNKRVTFLQYLELPLLTSQSMELALNMGDGDPPEVTAQKKLSAKRGPDTSSLTDYISDAVDAERLRNHGWKIRKAYDVAGSPGAYQAYIQASRGEFSCAKPSYLKFQNAWISDRSICYLATGKPVVVQNTGPSAYLPDGDGMFRFSSMDEAAGAIEAINSNYEHHCRSARDLAEQFFDSRKIASRILDHCLACAMPADVGAVGHSSATKFPAQSVRRQSAFTE